MKKVLALLIAASAAMSVGVTALADDVNSIENETNSIVTLEDSSSEESSSSSSEESSSESSSEESSSSQESSSEPTSSEGSSSEEEADPNAEPSVLYFGADEDTGATLDDILEPGTEYKFPVTVKIGDKTVPVSDELLKTYKFSYSKVSTKGMKTFEIDDYKGVYYLYVEAKDATPTKPVDVKYNVKLVRKANNLSVFSQEVKFQYGYDEAEHDYVTGLDEGDVVEIDNSRPVITASQFNKIAKINNYKNVTLAGSDWEFTVNVTDESTKNMLSNNAGVKEILSKFDDQDFKFYNFPGRPSFSATGRVVLDVEDIVDDFDKMYTYRYADGKLYKLNATFDGDESTLSFRTNKLDTFVVTNKLIKDGTVVTEADTSDKDDEGQNNGSSNSDKNNPGTGASDMINMAVMAAIASLAGAGAIAVKKASK